jgi:plastocyanin
MISGAQLMKTFRAACVGAAAVILVAGVSAMANLPARAGAGAAVEKSSNASEAGAGEITGKVFFRGEAPHLRPILMAKDPVCASLHPEGVLPEDGRVNANGTLPNAFAYVSKGTGNLSTAAPSEPVTLTQKECEYQPHVLGIMVGQTLQVVTEDPTTHNVHATPKPGHDFDVTQQPGSPPVTTKFTHPQIMVPVHCNIHNWMEAYIGVVTNPYYAVTGDDGSFVIKGVPAGTYTLAIWTASFGAQEREVTVRAGETASVDFNFGSR